MSMVPFTRHTGVAAPLLRDNIDTDVIIRIERLVSTSRRDDLGPWCLEALRYRPDGQPDPDFVLNRSEYREASILLAGENFGCGSSREGAVWALQQAGIRCVVASGFGDIFHGNCFQNGMLPVSLPPDAVQAIAAEVEADPVVARVTIDLVEQVVVSPSGIRHAFQIPALRRAGLLQGIDEIGLTLTRSADIAAFQAKDRQRRAWIYEPVSRP